MANNFDLSVIISAVDKFTAPVNRMSRKLDGLMAPVRRVKASFASLANAAGVDRLASSITRVRDRVGGLVDSVGQVAGRLALIGGGVAYGFNRMFIGTAATFEKYQTVLETLEGSSEKAKKSMDWVSEFAAKTPYELDGVMESFVKLRSYGLEPTNGLLRTLGDASAAMGKPLMQSVEAIADAITGENERLKEFGITARTEGDKITYSYMLNGKQMQATVNKNNREMIQKTLEMIWNDQYAGAMGKLSKTWEGMTSNLSDQWTRFVNMTMESGAFDWLKQRLDLLLATVDQMAADGTLQAWAQSLSDTFVRAFEAIEGALPSMLASLQNFADAVMWLKDVVGGWENLLIGVAAFIGAPMIAAVFTLVTALGSLGIALLTTPIGWFLGAIAAVAGAVYLIYRNWDGIAEWFGERWQAVKDGFNSSFIDGIVAVLKNFSPISLLVDGINALVQWFGGPDLLAMMRNAGGKIIDGIKQGIADKWGELTSWFSNKVSGLTDMLPDWMGFGGDEAAPQTSAGPGQGGALAFQAAAAQMRAQTGQLPQQSDNRLTILMPNAPRGTQMDVQGDGGMSIDTDMGYSMAGP